METVEAITFFSLEDLYQYGRLSEQLHVPYEELKPLQDISWGYVTAAGNEKQIGKDT